MYVRMSEWDLECIFLAQSAIGRAKITGENCGGNEKGEKKRWWESYENTGDKNPSRKSQFIRISIVQFGGQSDHMAAKKNEANT